ncbi:MAG: hypothetical protein ACR2IF_13430 [Terriglobales bacterium]
MRPIAGRNLQAELAAVATGRTYRIVDLGSFEGNHNLVHGINNQGTLVGAMLNPRSLSVEACVIEGHETRLLGTLGGSFSVARAINNRGDIVGGSLEQQDDNFHAFLFRNGKLQDLNKMITNPLGWELVQAVAINDLGQIVGIGSLAGEDRIFLLLPTPATQV